MREHAVKYCATRGLDGPMSRALIRKPKVMLEIMREMHRSLVGDERYEGIECDMSVSQLRKKLWENGEEIDGSKEMLILRCTKLNEAEGS